MYLFIRIISRSAVIIIDTGRQRGDNVFEKWLLRWDRYMMKKCTLMYVVNVIGRQIVLRLAGLWFIADIWSRDVRWPVFIMALLLSLVWAAGWSKPVAITYLRNQPLRFSAKLPKEPDFYFRWTLHDFIGCCSVGKPYAHFRVLKQLASNLVKMKEVTLPGTLRIG